MPGTKIPETGEYIHVPSSDWTSGDEDGKIRTIILSSKEGIKALYNVDKKKIFSYLFDKDKWSKSEAEKWVESHNKNEGWEISDEDMKINIEELFKAAKEDLLNA